MTAVFSRAGVLFIEHVINWFGSFNTLQSRLFIDIRSEKILIHTFMPNTHSDSSVALCDCSCIDQSMVCLGPKAYDI